MAPKVQCQDSSILCSTGSALSYRKKFLTVRRKERYPAEGSVIEAESSKGMKGKLMIIDRMKQRTGQAEKYVLLKTSVDISTQGSRIPIELLFLFVVVGCVQREKESSKISIGEDTPKDTECYVTEKDFNDCPELSPVPLIGRILVRDESASESSIIGQMTILRTQAELNAFWKNASFNSPDEIPHNVDFKTEEVVAWGFDSCPCHGGENIYAFHINPNDPSRWIAEVLSSSPCDWCDTGAQPSFTLWAIPIGEFELCRRGSRCKDCP